MDQSKSGSARRLFNNVDVKQCDQQLDVKKGGISPSAFPHVDTCGHVCTAVIAAHP